MLVLALEASTSSAKAALYDTEAGLVDLVREGFSGRSVKDGTVDPEKAYRALLHAGRTAAAGKDIQAIALCSIWQSLMACTKAVEPITPVYTWQSMAAREICAAVQADRELTDKLYSRTGCMPHYTAPRHVVQYLRAQGLDCSDKLFVTQGAYHFHNMTGCLRESVSTQCGTGLIEIRTKRYDPFVLDWLGLQEDQLGELASFRDTAPLLPEAAKKLGVAAGIPVVPAYPDGAMNQLGSNADTPGRMTLSVGTSGAMRMVTMKPAVSMKNRLWCYYGADRWIRGAATSGACNCINWLCGVLSRKSDLDRLDKAADKIRDVPVFLPFLYGERCPGWHNDAKAAFYDLKPEHDLASRYRAVQMGVLFNLLQCYEIMEDEVGKPREIIVSGGIINSMQWVQMLADIFRKKLTVSSDQDASCLGAAVLAMHAAGAVKSVHSCAVGRRNTVTVTPDPAQYDYYAGQYARYLEQYEAVCR